jgi:hypothetical protein
VTPKNLADASALLMLDQEQEECLWRCLQDEPIKRFLGIVDWLLSHEADEGYDPSSMIVGWAKLRGAGCFRPPEPTAAERTWSGNSPEQDREMQEAVSKGGSSQSCSSWGMRFSPEQVQANLDRMQG